MLRAVLADLHVGQVPGDLDRFLATVAAIERRGAGEVVFLGDLFRALVGYSRFWDATVRRGLDELAALRRSGVRGGDGRGQPRLLPRRRGPRPVSRRVRAPSTPSWRASRRFLLEHGDLVNRRDRSYLLLARGVEERSGAGLGAAPAPAPGAADRARDRVAVEGDELHLPAPAAGRGTRRQRPDATSPPAWTWCCGGTSTAPGSWSRAAGRRTSSPGWLETGTVVWIDGDGTLAFETERSEQIVDSAPGSWYQEEDSLGKAR